MIKESTARAVLGRIIKKVETLAQQRARSITQNLWTQLLQLLDQRSSLQVSSSSGA